MKKKKLIPTIALALALLCAFTLGANASSTLQQIKAYLNAGITVKLDGQTQTLKDANGNRIYPISYNGSTYLPIRAVSNMLGIEIGWDQATQTVFLGKQPKGVDLIDTYDIYHQTTEGWQSTVGQVRTADEKTEDVAGVTQSHWLYASFHWYGAVTATYNLQSKHDTLTFSYYATEDTVLKVTGDDGRVLGEYTITGGAVPKTVTVPLFRTSELKFEMAPANEHADPSVRIFNAYLDAE